MNLDTLSDGDLVSKVHELNRTDNKTTAELLRYLGEVDKRRLYAAQACSSMFVWCLQELNLSEPNTYRRIAAARLARRLPYVLEVVATGRVHLAGLAELSPVLTEDNHVQVLEAATHKSRKLIREIVADLRPKPDAPTGMRQLPGTDAPPVQDPPVPTPQDLFSPEPETDNEPTPEPTPEPAPLPTPAPPSAKRRDDVEPLGGKRYKVQLTVDQAWKNKLEEAQALLSNRVVDGDIGEVLDQALTALLDKLKKERFAEISARSAARQKAAATKSPDKTGKARSRHIPAEVRRKVIERDGYSCSFVDTAGRRCGERWHLEFHHEQPFAKVPEHKAESIFVRCRCHNDHAARQDFGEAFMEARRRTGRPRPVPA